MGNLCGKESPRSGFSSPGRVLGSAAPPSSRSTAVPGRTQQVPPAKKARAKVSGSGRTLGAESGDEREGQMDARTAAALAAEQRLKNSAGTGKLGLDLEKQKRMTQNQHLKKTGGDGKKEQLVWD